MLCTDNFVGTVSKKLDKVWANIPVEWIAFVLPIRKIPASNLGLESDYSGGDFSWVSSAPPGIFGIGHGRFFPNHFQFFIYQSSYYLLITSMVSLLTALLNILLKGHPSSLREILISSFHLCLGLSIDIFLWDFTSKLLCSFYDFSCACYAPCLSPCLWQWNKRKADCELQTLRFMEQGHQTTGPQKKQRYI